jgi:hypothetical protein
MWQMFGCDNLVDDMPSSMMKDIFRVICPAGQVASKSNVQATFFYLSCIEFS